VDGGVSGGGVISSGVAGTGDRQVGSGGTIGRSTPPGGASEARGAVGDAPGVAGPLGTGAVACGRAGVGPAVTEATIAIRPAANRNLWRRDLNGRVRRSPRESPAPQRVGAAAAVHVSVASGRGLSHRPQWGHSFFRLGPVLKNPNAPPLSRGRGHTAQEGRGFTDRPGSRRKRLPQILRFRRQLVSTPDGTAIFALRGILRVQNWVVTSVGPGTLLATGGAHSWGATSGVVESLPSLVVAKER
jgi:hypothetical protein